MKITVDSCLEVFENLSNRELIEELETVVNAVKVDEETKAELIAIVIELKSRM